MPDGLSTLADSQDAQALLEFLRDRDVACPLCKYNLRALTSARCPECGRELRLSVGLVEQRQGAWLTTQIALAAAAGIGFIIIVSTMMHGWPELQQRQWLFNLCGIYWLLAIPSAACWFMIRRRFLRAAAAVQWSVALSTIAATAMSIFCMVLTD